MPVRPEFNLTGAQLTSVGAVDLDAVSAGLLDKELCGGDILLLVLLNFRDREWTRRRSAFEWKVRGRHNVEVKLLPAGGAA